MSELRVKWVSLSPYEQGFRDACWAFRNFIDNVPSDSALRDIDGPISAETMREIRELFEQIDAMREKADAR